MNRLLSIGVLMLSCAVCLGGDERPVFYSQGSGAWMSVQTNGTTTNVWVLVGTNDENYVGAITGAVYGAGTVPSVSGHVLTIGTNNFGGAAGSGDFKADGSVPMSGVLNFGGQEATNLATPTTASSATTKEYVDGVIGGYAYISGAWCEYLNTTQVTWLVTDTNFGGGAGWCSNKYWTITSSFNSTVSSLSPATNFWHYGYLSYASLPAISIYWTTTTPTKSGLNQWVCSTQTTDRLMSSLYSTGNVIKVFSRTRAGEYGCLPLVLISSGNPNGALQSPTSALSTNVPLTASAALLDFTGGDINNQWQIVIVPFEASSTYAGALTYTDSAVLANLERTEWLPLGQSRDILFYGYDNDDNAVYIACRGWREDR